DLRAAQNRVAAEAAVALSNGRAALARLQNARTTRTLAERSYEAAAERFKYGQTIAITVQQAQDDLRRARLRVARARVDLVQQSLNLQHLSGELVQRYGALDRP